MLPKWSLPRKRLAASDRFAAPSRQPGVFLGEGNGLKRLLLALLTLVLLLAAIAAGVIVYIKPAEALDLNYKEISIRDKVAQMITKRQFAVELSEDDVANIVKKQLSQRPQFAPDILLTGARVDLAGSRATVVANVRYKQRIPAEIRLAYELEWHAPNLRISLQDAAIKQMTLPRARFNPEPIDINLNELLPDLVAVKDVQFAADSVRIDLKLR